MEQQRKPTDIWLKRATAVTVIGAASIIGIDRLNNLGILDGFGLPDVPDLPINIEPDPPVVSASIDPAFTAVEEEFDIRCRGRISVAVGVRGFMNGPFGDGKVDKKIFGDFLPCSETLPGSATLIPDPQTGAVERIEIVYEPLVPTQGRVDFEDGRNCANVDAKDSFEEAQKKIAERNAAIENGENPDCDDGFTVTQLFGSSDLAEVINLSHAAAQVAIEYADPDAYAEINQQNLNDITDYYQKQYPDAYITVKTDLAVPYMDYVQDKIAQHQERAKAQKNGSQPVFESVVIERLDDDGCAGPAGEELAACNVLVAYGYDGGSVRISLSDVHTEVELEGNASVRITQKDGSLPKPLGPVGVDPMQNNLEDFLDITPDTTTNEPAAVGPVAPSTTEPNDFFDLTD